MREGLDEKSRLKWARGEAQVMHPQRVARSEAAFTPSMGTWPGAPHRLRPPANHISPFTLM